MEKDVNLLEVEFTEEICRELIPELGSGPLDISVLKGGITNKLYRVRAGESDMAVRIYGDKTELFINRDYEAQAMREMAKAGISPRLVKYLPEYKVTVVDYITDSITLCNDDFLKEDLYQKIMDPIRRIHDSKAVLPKVFNPRVEIDKMREILAGLEVPYPEFAIDETIGRLQALFSVIAIPEGDYTPSHNDLLAENFILSKDGDLRFTEPMYIIDWEYAGMAPRYYDIADMFQEILVPREAEEKLIACYCREGEYDDTLRLVNLFKPFPDIYWFIWSLIQYNISTIEFDFYNYGKVKYENAIGNLDFINRTYGQSV